ncbi:MAG: hypothetical protein ABIT58_09765, partial [Ferruginibacter sp.]
SHKLFLLFFLAICVISATAQMPKVVRKGMPPITEINTVKKNKAFYNFSQLAGKWQEVKRTTIKSKQPVEFSDTLLMSFFDSNKVEIKDATSMRMSMKGDAYIDPPYNLNAAGDEYFIRGVDKDRLLLDDGDYLKEMNRKDQFYFETLGKIKVHTEILNTPINVEAKNLEGKWLVYRRQAIAGSVDTDAVVIKSLEIYPSNTTGSAMGKVVSYKSDITESLPCKIIYGTGNILVITDNYVWEFNTYKADGKEFVFGEAGRLLYYAKR